MAPRVPLRLSEVTGGVGLKTGKSEPGLMRGEVWITVSEFAAKANLSRRQIDRLRRTRPSGFPTEYELATGSSVKRRCPRFKLSDVDHWLTSRALW